MKWKNDLTCVAILENSDFPLSKLAYCGKPLENFIVWIAGSESLRRHPINGRRIEPGFGSISQALSGPSREGVPGYVTLRCETGTSCYRRDVILSREAEVKSARFAYRVGMEIVFE